MEPVTQLLLRLRHGDEQAREQLFSLIYNELRRVAGALLRREAPGHTLAPTALVHEAYLRLADADHLDANSRSHFLGIAARAMRHILVDHARSRDAAKRGGGLQKITLKEQLVYSPEHAPQIVALHEALEELARLDPRKAQVIELRFFGGLEGEEIAQVLHIGRATVTRDLRTAQAWLAQALRQE